MSVSAYRLAWGDSPDVLVKGVNMLINEGWQPLGGVAVALPSSIRLDVLPDLAGVQQNVLVYIQGMIKGNPL